MSVVHRFTLGGVADSTLGLQLLRGYEEPALPSTRDRAVAIPGRQGEWDFGADLRERKISLQCALTGATTQAGLAALIRALSAVLLDVDGKPVDCALVFDKEPTKTYTVRYCGSLSIARLCAATLGTLTIPLVAHDPYAYGAEEETEESITVDGQEVTVTNSGAFRSAPVITLHNVGGTSVTGITLTTKKQL